MYQVTPMIMLPGDSLETIRKTIDSLSVAGLQVVQSFDLQVARSAHTECTCPHHGTDQCDCQLVVLLVYGPVGSPVTLVIHGHDGQAEIALADTPDQRLASQLVNSIRQALLPVVKRAQNVGSISLGNGNRAR